MKKILIVSPDPEAGRMLELAFELHGWEAEHTASLKGMQEGKTDALLFDMVEGMDEFRKGIKKGSFKGSKVVAIAPQGEDDGAIHKKVPRIDLAVKRPYELIQLVKSVENLMGDR